MEVSVNCGNTNIGELDYEKDIIAFGDCTDYFWLWQ